MAVLIAQEQARAETDMAKAPPADPALVSRYAEALAAARESRSAFQAILSEIRENSDLRSNDVISIAIAYRGGGVRPRSKKHALEMIEKRFVEIVRDAKKNLIASRVRPGKAPPQNPLRLGPARHLRQIADGEPKEMPATVDDPAILDEITEVMQGHGVVR
jgi:hypothetical protein